MRNHDRRPQHTPVICRPPGPHILAERLSRQRRPLRCRNQLRRIVVKPTLQREAIDQLSLNGRHPVSLWALRCGTKQATNLIECQSPPVMATVSPGVQGFQVLNGRLRRASITATAWLSPDSPSTPADGLLRWSDAGRIAGVRLTGHAQAAGGSVNRRPGRVDLARGQHRRRRATISDRGSAHLIALHCA